MGYQPEPPPVDPALRLTRDAYYVLVHTLRGTLLPPVIDTPEEVARRDNAAIAQVATMLPANADEAFLAAQCVGARLYGMDCIRLARGFAETDQMWARKCAAMGNSSLRESRQARSLLARLQAAREKREADGAATDRAAWSEHCTIGLMTDALADAPPAAPAEPPQPPQPPQPLAPAVAEPPADAKPKHDLAAVRDHVSAPRQADPRPGRPARQPGLRSARPRIGPLHRQRHHTRASGARRRGPKRSRRLARRRPDRRARVPCYVHLRSPRLRAALRQPCPRGTGRSACICGFNLLPLGASGLCSPCATSSRLATPWDGCATRPPVASAQRVTATTNLAAAEAIRSTAATSTACGQRSCGRRNHGLLPTNAS
jgi:hypothetical protein